MVWPSTTAQAGDAGLVQAERQMHAFPPKCGMANAKPRQVVYPESDMPKWLLRPICIQTGLLQLVSDIVSEMSKPSNSGSLIRNNLHQEQTPSPLKVVSWNDYSGC